MTSDHGDSGIRLRRLYEYGISPFVQKTFGPDYKATWRAFGRGTVSAVKLWWLPAIIYSGIVWWGGNYYHRLHRKDPYDYWIEELEAELNQLKNK